MNASPVPVITVPLAARVASRERLTQSGDAV